MQAHDWRDVEAFAHQVEAGVLAPLAALLWHGSPAVQVHGLHVLLNLASCQESPRRTLTLTRTVSLTRTLALTLTLTPNL